MPEDLDEIIRRSRLPPLPPTKRPKGVAWKTIADSRKAQPAFKQPPVLAGIARQIGADK